ncbi:hypothetical protein H2200_004428 [Cladophialophora chaetospira]|uniref:Uncharacterized protein n=1 Tax=Cladophialophora chaetospira TaxID=386627 RepID=A0AA38XDA8_9EURO|nr:hypothetical protein H2200_004428 [Cladophialophora chaetospira]
MPSGGSHFRYSDEVRNLVLIQLAAEVRPSDISNALGVSKPFISQVKARSKVDPEVLRRNKRPRGRPPKLQPYAVEAVRDHVAQHPKCQRGEVIEMLKNRFGLEDIHATTIGRLIRKLKEDLAEEPYSTRIAGQTSDSQQGFPIDSTQDKTQHSEYNSHYAAQEWETNQND